MVTWAEFSAAEPELAAEGRRLFYRGDVGEALLATVRGDEPPRIHPIWVDEVRSAIGAQWYFEPDETYELFEFSIESALLGKRDGPDDWPPRYSSWTSMPDA